MIEAYLSGLEAFVDHGGDPAGVQDVASFFVSRVDTEVDGRLEAIAASERADKRSLTCPQHEGLTFANVR